MIHCRFLVVAGALVAAAPALAQQTPAGLYRASAGPDVASAIELAPDGRFRYQRSEGALDEEAAGRWSETADGVVLDTLPHPRPPEWQINGIGEAKDSPLTVTVKVPGSGNDLCTSYSTVNATVEAVSNYAIILTDNRSLNDGFTKASYDSVAQEFDTYVYPTETGYFGAPTDIDHNGHVFILYTPAVNLLTPPGTATTGGYVGGYTFAGDFFPPYTRSCR